MESTSIWFGPCRSKPQRPVLLTEEGFTVFLNAQDGRGDFLCQNSDTFYLLIDAHEFSSKTVGG